VIIPISSPAQFYRLKTWEVLFNGTSLDAFRGYRQTWFPVNDWLITLNSELKTMVGSPAGHIVTTNQFDDFELIWEWKTGSGGNSGVMYRATEYYDQPYKSAPEYQLIDDVAYASSPANQKTGAVYGIISPTNKVSVTPGVWYQCRLIVQGNHVEHWLNGRRIVQYELNSASFNSAVAGSSFSSYTQFGKARKGFIAIQNWTPEVWFRNIKLRSLPSNP
jgi:hypothetical protein